jgi:2-polyprenyl-3-methyl-5-hydroxy-6-metoxy-1,4-benzoquinol methylase
MQHAADFWDNAAEKYARSPIGDTEAYEYTLGRIRSYLSQTDRVLEVGCGTGSTALLLAPDVAHVTAGDLSQKMIAIASGKAEQDGVSNAGFVVSDLFGPALERGPYDAVLALNMIHLLEDTPAAMQRIAALVKPGGMFMSKTVCSPGRGTPWKFRLMRLIVPLMQWLGKAPFVKFMDTAELERHIADAGFKIIETGDHPPPSRFIVARKLA